MRGARNWRWNRLKRPATRIFDIFLQKLRQNINAPKREVRKLPQTETCTWEASGGLIMPSGAVPTPQEARKPFFLSIIFCKITPKLENKGPKKTKNHKFAYKIFLRAFPSQNMVKSDTGMSDTCIARNLHVMLVYFSYLFW